MKCVNLWKLSGNSEIFSVLNRLIFTREPFTSTRTVKMNLVKQWCEYERSAVKFEVENIVSQIGNAMHWMAQYLICFLFAFKISKSVCFQRLYKIHSNFPSRRGEESFILSVNCSMKWKSRFIHIQRKIHSTVFCQLPIVVHKQTHTHAGI